MPDLSRVLRFVRKRIEWKRTARRHRKLDPLNMSGLPWARHYMDEQTGEIFDRRTHSKRAALRCFRANGFDFDKVTVQGRHARYMTRQEIWEARDRADEWKERLGDKHYESDEARPTDLLLAEAVPDLAPADWEPDVEWDPAWQFCSASDPNASPVWLCEAADV